MATSPAAAATQIGIQDFLRILVAQLSNQDPLKPLDNQEFVTQLAQFTSLQQTQEMNDKLSSLLSAEASSQSIGLLGRNVEVRTENGFSTGSVSAMRFEAGEPRLTLTLSGGAILTDVRLADLVSVRLGG